MSEENSSEENSTEEPSDDLRDIIEAAANDVEEQPEEEASEASDSGSEEPGGDGGDTGSSNRDDQGVSAPGAPVDWGPELREQWGSLPEGVRQKVLARERHIEEAMQGTAMARRVASDFQQLGNPEGFG